MSRADIVRWVIDCMVRHVPGITPELALTVERECRAEWGGQSAGYIAKTCSSAREQRPARRGAMPSRVERMPGESRPANPAPSELQGADGMSRAALYRMLKR